MVVLLKRYRIASSSRRHKTQSTTATGNAESGA